MENDVFFTKHEYYFILMVYTDHGVAAYQSIDCLVRRLHIGFECRLHDILCSLF